MTPYYADNFVTLYHGDARESEAFDGVVMTDPPYNIGYGYATYRDKLPEAEYLSLIAEICAGPSVVIHYPEAMFRIAMRMGESPQEVVAWVYNSNHPTKMWRTVAWFGTRPDMSLVARPYKNPDDRRVKALIEAGKSPGLYDWWYLDQVKNVSDEKLGHPCQVPLELMARIIAVTPAEVIIDPFAGSGTTLRAAKDAGRRAIGIEMDESYCEMAAIRLSQEVLGLVG